MLVLGKVSQMSRLIQMMRQVLNNLNALSPGIITCIMSALGTLGKHIERARDKIHALTFNPSWTS